jgi:nitrogen regulatory protein P-II 1
LDAKGHGQQKGIVQQFRGKEYRVELLPKIKLEMVINNEEKLESILSAIIDNARTGEVGDGKIFIWPIEDVIRIRTRERGEEAI